MNKAIITVVGKDQVGIIAKVCAYLSSVQINVEDISQTIVQGYFNMMMVADIKDATKEFKDIKADLNQLGEDLSCIINIQKEEIFDAMHRI